MRKRMQVMFEDAEYTKLQRAAKRNGMSLAEWVRHSLRIACQREAGDDTEKKLAAVRAAARHGFPTADIDQVLVEIERGYRGGRWPQCWTDGRGV